MKLNVILSVTNLIIAYREKAISTNAPSCRWLVEIAFSQLCLQLLWMNEAGSFSSL